MSGEAWDSGVGGVQCDGCGDTTVVRKVTVALKVDGGSNPFDGDGEWLCRPCYVGEHNDFDDEDDQR